MRHRPRLAAGDLSDHVLNHGVGLLPLFEKPADYAAFETILAEAHDRTGIRIAAKCLMPNHWHLLLWQRQDGALSEVLRWITVTHTQRWHAHYHRQEPVPCIKAASRHFPCRPMNIALPWRAVRNSYAEGAAQNEAVSQDPVCFEDIARITMACMISDL